MKYLVYLIGILALLGAVGCEEEHEHGHWGGSHEGYYGGYGHGEYQVAPSGTYYYHHH